MDLHIYLYIKCKKHLWHTIPCVNAPFKTPEKDLPESQVCDLAMLSFNFSGRHRDVG